MGGSSGGWTRSAAWTRCSRSRGTTSADRDPEALAEFLAFNYVPVGDARLRGARAAAA